MSTKGQWRNSIRPRIETAREVLRQQDCDALARSSGATREVEDLVLSLFATPLRITVPGFEILSADATPCLEETQILILDYLTHSGSASVSPAACSDWIGFQELPDGAFYAKAFRSYTSDVLESRMNGDIDRFRLACERFGGTFFSLGDAAFSFCALPAVKLAVVWWAGDDEFPAHANVLFDRAAAHALPIDGMAALGSLLCRGLLSTIQAEEQK